MAYIKDENYESFLSFVDDYYDYFYDDDDFEDDDFDDDDDLDCDGWYFDED